MIRKLLGRPMLPRPQALCSKRRREKQRSWERDL